MAEKITRREMLKLSGVTIAGVALGASGVGGVIKILEDEPAQAASNKIPFYGKHQSGVQTPHQAHVYFASLKFVGTSKAQLQKLLQDWTVYAEKMMAGQSVEEESSTKHIPPVDTAEAMGLDAARLSLTFGVGPSLFERAELDLKSKKPAELVDLPHFPRDQLQEQWTGGDLCIQACADDPQVAFHAVRNLVRVGSGLVQLQWTQDGFISVPADGGTPRNLFSFKDGTVNPKTDQEFDEHVWVSGSDQSWLNNGTYLIVRRIQMHLETWDRTSLHQQEQTFGRYRDNGALFGQKDEFAETDVLAKNIEGKHDVPENSHVYLSRLAKQTIFRRPYSYSTGIVSETGTYDSGLLFISFQQKPQQFIDIQNSLGRLDKLNEYITHRGSAMFACLPGVQKGSYLGEALFTSL